MADKNSETRLSTTEMLILSMLLREAKPMYGLQLVAEAGGRIARGSIYVTLDRMEEKGLVRSEQEKKDPGVSGIPRRMYEPTGHGARAYRKGARVLAQGLNLSAAVG
jgi:PadR family transcriptional regulator PadR